MLYAEMCKLPKADSKRLGRLQEWMQSPSMGNVYLVGRDHSVYSDGEDLIALQAPNSDHRLFRLLDHTLAPMYHRIFGKHHKVSTSNATFQD